MIHRSAEGEISKFTPVFFAEEAPSYSSASLRASSRAFCRSSRASSRALRLSSALFSASSRASSLSFAASSAPPPTLAGEGEAVGGALGEAVGDGCPAAPRAGPVPTVTSTVLPLFALFPAAGSCPTTVPRSASPLEASTGAVPE
jgi:hypothetical protein